MSGPPRTPSRTPSYASISTNGDSTSNAALLGATKAFGRPPPKARAASNNYSGMNGALAAATRVSATPSPQQKHGLASSPGQPVTPSSSTGSKSDAVKKTPVLDPNTTPSLEVPRQRGRSKSPSHQAAQLAAARSSPDARDENVTGRARANTTQKPSVAPKPRRLSDHYTKAVEGPTDLSPIPPTTSLVQLFERKSSTPSPDMRPNPITVRPQHDLPMRSPKPLRSADGGITTVFQMELGDSKAVPRPAGSTAAKNYDTSRPREDDDDSDEYVSASEDTAAPGSSPITIRKRDSRAPSASSLDTVSPIRSELRRPRASPSPLRHSSSTQPLPIQKPPSRNFTSPAHAPSMSSASQSGRSIASQYNMLHPRRMTPLNTGDDLANAIVASSLASSRAPSPRKVEPPPVPTRKQKHGHHMLGFSRTPSPTKHAGMRHTLRKEESEDSDTAEDERHPYGKHKKKRIVRKHPNKHHEGDRKRWRDAVTERERKRYEGVWAANKGLHCEDRVGSELQVSNIVTRDIWQRSRLSDSMLEIVWDLVDGEGQGQLGKEEFVVGMWLIDQRLKGRKLPVKVSGSVWQSVRGLQGIKIRKMM